jgi:competence protein ComEC
MNQRLSKSLALLIGLSLTAAVRAGEGDGRLDIYWVDVEGGGATLIVTPSGESVLIDTGNPGGRDPGRIAHVAKDVAGLKRLDHVVITHFHTDHFGGAAELAVLIPIIDFYDYGVRDEDRDVVGQAYLSFKAGQRHVFEAGQTIPLRQREGGTKLSFTCVAARQKVIESTPQEQPNDAGCKDNIARPIQPSANDDSVASVLRFGPFDFYDAGDLTWNVEGRLVCPNNLIGVVDVYQVTHHGLDVSNNWALVRSLKPTVTVMNNGDKKGCNPVTFDTLEHTPSIQAMYQLHKNLKIEKNNTADQFIANTTTGADCKGNYIKMSVAPDGKTYTVTIPANGHKRTYQTK